MHSAWIYTIALAWRRFTLIRFRGFSFDDLVDQSGEHVESVAKLADTSLPIAKYLSKLLMSVIPDHVCLLTFVS